jgi:hypothetical protein
MNFWKRENRLSSAATMVGATLVLVAAWLGAIRTVASAAGKGLDVEVPYEIKALKAPGLTAPYFAQEYKGGLVVSDQAGGVFNVTFAGKATELAGKSKIKNPAGVAVGPNGFGSYAGQVFVLVAADAKAVCEVDRIDGSGSVSTFAKLPDAGSAATECRDLEFGKAGTPFAGKLYAATTGNSSIYAIDGTGKATVFGSYTQPLVFELTTITFAPATDTKAPNMMLVGLRSKTGGASRLGRIGIVGPDGKLKDDVYMVGFVRPSGFAWSSSTFGSYPDELFIADTGKFASENNNERDGVVYRVEKGVSRSWASGLMDPTDMKFMGNKFVLCDPAEKGKGQGAVVIISSLL